MRFAVLILVMVFLCGSVIAEELRPNFPGMDDRSDDVLLRNYTIDKILTYQGLLRNNNGDPVADGTYNMTFRIFNAPSLGITIWNSPSMPVTTQDGYFSVELGPLALPFDTTYYISVQVESDMEMARQRIAISPYSASSDTSNYSFRSDTSAVAMNVPDNSITSANITNATIQFADIGQNGASVGQVMKWNGSAWVPLADTFGVSHWTLDDSVLYTNDYWGIVRGGAGNVIRPDSARTIVNLGVACTTFYQPYYATIGGGFGNYIGYTRGGAISGGVNNKLWGYYDYIGGGSKNVIAGGVESAICGGEQNTIYGHLGFIGSGYKNVISMNGYSGIVCGGQEDSCLGNSSFIGGGYRNKTDTTGYEAAICGGRGNIISGMQGAIGGGAWNSVRSFNSGVFSGISNRAGDSEDDTCAIVGGGWSNKSGAKFASILGGFADSASGEYSVVVGGQRNMASGNFSGVASGARNRASGEGSFVGGGWADTASGLYSTVGGGISNKASGIVAAVSGGSGNVAGGNNSVISGGIGNVAPGIYGVICGGSGNFVNGDKCVVLGGERDSIDAAAYSSMAYGSFVYLNTSRRVAFYEGDFSGYLGINRDDRNGGINFPIHVGTSNLNGNGAYLTAGGVWTNGSSSTFKENFTPFDGGELLSKIFGLSITFYNYKNSAEKHIGPVAEEFVEAFDTGIIRESDGKRDDKYLSSGDVAGVALAGVQELIRRNSELKNENDNMKQRISDLEMRLSRLENR